MVTLTKKQNIAIAEGILCVEDGKKRSDLTEQWFLDHERQSHEFIIRIRV
jgi:hypothetical protein